MKSETNLWTRFLVAAGMLVATAIYLRAHGQGEYFPPRPALESFPLKFADWVGRNEPITGDVREVLGSGDFVEHIYSRGRMEPPVDLFVAYFPTQRTGSTIHSPKNCLPGSGWLPTESGQMQLTSAQGKPITVNRYIIARGDDKAFVLYWYQSHGRVVASEYWSRIYLVVDSIRMSRSDGALVRVITSVGQGESVDSAQTRAAAFAERIMPLLDKYIPR